MVCNKSQAAVSNSEVIKFLETLPSEDDFGSVTGEDRDFLRRLYDPLHDIFKAARNTSRVNRDRIQTITELKIPQSLLDDFPSFIVDPLDFWERRLQDLPHYSKKTGLERTKIFLQTVIQLSNNIDEQIILRRFFATSTYKLFKRATWETSRTTPDNIRQFISAAGIPIPNDPDEQKDIVDKYGIIIRRGQRQEKICKEVDDSKGDDISNEIYGTLFFDSIPDNIWEDKKSLAGNDFDVVIRHLRSVKATKTANELGASSVAKSLLDFHEVFVGIPVLGARSQSTTEQQASHNASTQPRGSRHNERTENPSQRRNKRPYTQTEARSEERVACPLDSRQSQNYNQHLPNTATVPPMSQLLDDISCDVSSARATSRPTLQPTGHNASQMPPPSDIQSRQSNNEQWTFTATTNNLFERLEPPVVNTELPQYQGRNRQRQDDNTMDSQNRYRLYSAEMRPAPITTDISDESHDVAAAGILLNMPNGFRAGSEELFVPQDDSATGCVCGSNSVDDESYSQSHAAQIAQHIMENKSPRDHTSDDGVDAAQQPVNPTHVLSDPDLLPRRDERPPERFIGPVGVESTGLFNKESSLQNTPAFDGQSVSALLAIPPTEQSITIPQHILSSPGTAADQPSGMAEVSSLGNQTTGYNIQQNTIMSGDRRPAGHIRPVDNAPSSLTDPTIPSEISNNHHSRESSMDGNMQSSTLSSNEAEETQDMPPPKRQCVNCNTSPRHIRLEKTTSAESVGEVPIQNQNLADSQSFEFDDEVSAQHRIPVFNWTAFNFMDETNGVHWSSFDFMNEPNTPQHTQDFNWSSFDFMNEPSTPQRAQNFNWSSFEFVGNPDIV